MAPRIPRSRTSSRRVPIGVGGAGRVFGLGRLGISATDYTNSHSLNAYANAGYTGGFVWAYASEFPQLNFDTLADTLPAATTFADLVAQGVLTRSDVITGFNVDPTFAANNPANIDNGIMKSQVLVTAPNDMAGFNTAVANVPVSPASATQATPPDPTTQIFLKNGENVNGNGVAYPPSSPHYYNQLTALIDQTLASGGTPGVLTVAEQALINQYPNLVNNLPSDLVTQYGGVITAFLNPPAPATPATAPVAPTPPGQTTTPATPPVAASGGLTAPLPPGASAAPPAAPAEAGAGGILSDLTSGGLPLYLLLGGTVLAYMMWRKRHS